MAQPDGMLQLVTKLMQDKDELVRKLMQEKDEHVRELRRKDQEIFELRLRCEKANAITTTRAAVHDISERPQPRATQSFGSFQNCAASPNEDARPRKRRKETLVPHKTNVISESDEEDLLFMRPHRDVIQDEEIVKQEASAEGSIWSPPSYSETPDSQQPPIPGKPGTAKLLIKLAANQFYFVEESNNISADIIKLVRNAQLYFEHQKPGGRWTSIIKAKGCALTTMSESNTVWSVENPGCFTCRTCFKKRRPCFVYIGNGTWEILPLPSSVGNAEASFGDLAYYIYDNVITSRHQTLAGIW